MPSNRDKLRRTRDGRYEVGVYIEKDKYARYVAKVLVAYEREGVSQVAMTMPPAPNFDLADRVGDRRHRGRGRTRRVSRGPGPAFAGPGPGQLRRLRDSRPHVLLHGR